MTVDDDIWKCAEELLMASLAATEGKDKEAAKHLKTAYEYPSHIVKVAGDQLKELIDQEKARRRIKL